MSTRYEIVEFVLEFIDGPSYNAYGENLIALCSQVHDNFTMGVNRKILISLIYLFIQETYLTCAKGL